MSDSNSIDRIPTTENLGGMGDTDDLSVIGIVDPTDQGKGFGLIDNRIDGYDEDMLHRTDFETEAQVDSEVGLGVITGDEPTQRRKPVDGDVAVNGSTKPMRLSKDLFKKDKKKDKAKHGKPGIAEAGKSVAPKILAACLVVFLGALVGVWAYGRAHYSEHLFPGRMVDGVNVSGMTAKEAEETTSVERWSFVVDDRGARYELGAEDVGFETEEIDFNQIIEDQDANLWFLHVIAPNRNEVIRKSTYDSNKVHASVMALPCISGEREQPVDASVKRTDEGFAYEVVPEVEGNVVDSEIIEAAVEKALSEGKDGAIDLDKADAYVHPVVYSDNESMLSAVETANKWLRTSITYDIDGLESVETLGPETIAQWVDIVRENPEKPADDKGDAESEENPEGEENEDEGETDGEAIQVFGRNAPGDAGGMFYQVNETVLDDGGRADTANDDKSEPTFRATFNDEGLRGWLSGIGNEYDTAGKPKTITNPNGTVKEVGGGGSYGWITDEASEFDAIKASLAEGEKTHREFAMKQRAALPKGQNEWGNTYIEIDLSEQHLWYIRNGEVILSYGVITGKSGYETPTMVSQVYSKVTDIVLVSPWKDANGEPTYKTHIDVGLVISSDGGILCHDAPWQPSYGFGSPSYHWSGGSHGCCNMKTSQCWELYNTASVGDPVVVHY